MYILTSFSASSLEYFQPSQSFASNTGRPDSPVALAAEIRPGSVNVDDKMEIIVGIHVRRRGRLTPRFDVLMSR